MAKRCLMWTTLILGHMYTDFQLVNDLFAPNCTLFNILRTIILIANFILKFNSVSIKIYSVNFVSFGSLRSPNRKTNLAI